MIGSEHADRLRSGLERADRLLSGLEHADRLRGQSHVVGVAILLGTTMVSLGLLTASVGVVLEDSAAGVGADRVASDLERSLEPVAATGENEGRVTFVDGRLRVVDRSFRVLNDSGPVYEDEVGALVFETGSTRVSFASGLIATDDASGATRRAEPPIAASEETLLIGVVRLNASGVEQISASATTTVPLRTTVDHERRSLADGPYRVAVETATPRPWERHFETTGANTTRRTFVGDDHESVVGHYDGNRRSYLIVHDLGLEVGR
jgi:hypothetical protein